MRLQDVTEDEFVSAVKEKNQGIVIYGAGVIGKNVAPAFIEERGLEDAVLFIADVDSRLHGLRIRTGKREIEICDPERMDGIKKSFAVLLTGSRYEPILSDLGRREALSDADVYILPQMLVKKCRHFEKSSIERQVPEAVIPKEIHYCWFGRGALPDDLKRYRESWEIFCPDYQIREWNEDNYDVDRQTFTREAYRHKKWAFVSDMAKLEILYQHGGIYLDTDVELIRPLDELLYQPGFVGVEKWGMINIGGGCGVVPKHPMMKEILEYYRQVVSGQGDRVVVLESSGNYESKPLLDHGFKPNNTVQTINGMTVYTSDFFHPYDYMSGELCVTENTCAIHHFTQSWV